MRIPKNLLKMNWIYITFMMLGRKSEVNRDPHLSILYLYVIRQLQILYDQHIIPLIIAKKRNLELGDYLIFRSKL